LDQKPGPGQYELNDYTNTNSKGCKIAEKFGKVSVGLAGPGPGSYEAEPRRPMSGTKIGKSKRDNYDRGIGPGPGAYECSYKAKTSSEIKIGMGQRNNILNAETPGPGAYHLA
jgi:hypothetical protein